MDTILHKKNRFTWALLAMQAGFVNIGGLLTVHIFVSHITGFSAHFSLALLENNFAKTFYFSAVPICFLIGAFFCATFTEIRKKKKKNIGYIHMLSLLSLIFLSISTAGNYDVFGQFGEEFQGFRDFILLSLLAFSCGIQNALFTHYSNSIIRTTHLTGITTDLGIGIAKYFISKNIQEGPINRIRIDLILSFIIGSMIGALVFPILEFLGFLIPTFTSLFVGFRLLFTSNIIHKEHH